MVYCTHGYGYKHCPSSMTVEPHTSIHVEIGLRIRLCMCGGREKKAFFVDEVAQSTSVCLWIG